MIGYEHDLFREFHRSIPMLFQLIDRYRRRDVIAHGDIYGQLNQLAGFGPFQAGPLPREFFALPSLTFPTLPFIEHVVDGADISLDTGFNNIDIDAVPLINFIFI